MWQAQWEFFNEGSTNPLTWTELEKISFEGRKNIQCLDITSYQKTHISWHRTFFFTQFECYDYMDIKIITDVVEYMENIGNLMYPPYFYGLVAYEHQNESSPNFFPRKLNNTEPHDMRTNFFTAVVVREKRKITNFSSLRAFSIIDIFLSAYRSNRLLPLFLMV